MPEGPLARVTLVKKYIEALLEPRKDHWRVSHEVERNSKRGGGKQEAFV